MDLQAEEKQLHKINGQCNDGNSGRYGDICNPRAFGPLLMQWCRVAWPLCAAIVLFASTGSNAQAWTFTTDCGDRQIFESLELDTVGGGHMRYVGQSGLSIGARVSVGTTRVRLSNAILCPPGDPDYPDFSSEYTVTLNSTDRTRNQLPQTIGADTGLHWLRVWFGPAQVGRTLIYVYSAASFSSGATEAEPLTVDFEETPSAHDGTSAFTFQLAFSEAVDIDGDGLLSELTVNGGVLTAAQQVDGRSDLWELTMEPSGNAAVTILVPARACTETGAICTEDNRALQAGGAIFIAYRLGGPELTAEWVKSPSAHSGSGRAFTVRAEFSEPVTTSANNFRNHALTVTGGSINKVRKVKGSASLWAIKVTPTSLEPLTLSVAATEDCDAQGAICTANDKPLSNAVSLTVSGPTHQLTVEDAEVQERQGGIAALTFVVKLSEPAPYRVKVDFATSDGTATAGQDYLATEGTAAINRGATATVVTVRVYDDAHDEGSETLTLTLSNPKRAAIADGVATGTINNTDHMPTAWISRFGRTVADQVLDAVDGRLRAARSPGMSVNLAGQHVSSAGSLDGTTLYNGFPPTAAERTFGDWQRNESNTAREHSFESRAVTARDLLTSSSFSLAGGSEQSGFYALWGHGARTSFDGREDSSLSLDGEVTSGMLGADWTMDAATAGLVVSHSRGKSSYDGESAGGGITSSLTGLYPWGSYVLSERLSIWAVAGIGQGSLTLTPAGGAPIRTDLNLKMVGAGLRSMLLQAPQTGGFELAVKTDAMSVQTNTAKVSGLVAAEAKVTRLRLGVEGSRLFQLEDGTSLTPSVELGLRIDGGDAETGSGVVLDSGLQWSDAGRLSVEVHVRTLLTHEDEDYEELGVSASLIKSPGENGRGLSIRADSSWGANSRGVEHLWTHRAGEEGVFEPDARFGAEVGYGLDAVRGLLTPYTGVSVSANAETWRTGARWKLGPTFDLNIEATLRESTGDEERQSGIIIQGSKRW